MGFFYTNRKTQHDQSQSGQQLSAFLPPSSNTLFRSDNPSLPASPQLLHVVFFKHILLLHGNHQFDVLCVIP